MLKWIFHIRKSQTVFREISQGCSKMNNNNNKKRKTEPKLVWIFIVMTNWCHSIQPTIHPSIHPALHPLRQISIVEWLLGILLKKIDIRTPVVAFEPYEDGQAIYWTDYSENSAKQLNMNTWQKKVLRSLLKLLLWTKVNKSKVIVLMSEQWECSSLTSRHTHTLSLFLSVSLTLSLSFWGFSVVMDDSQLPHLKMAITWFNSGCHV